MKRPRDPTEKPIDPYKVLKLARDAGQNDIKKAYFKLVREHPPETDQEKFREIRVAYEILRSPERRAETDLFLLQAPTPLAKYSQQDFDLEVKDEDIIALAFELGVTNVSWSKEFEEPDLSGI